MLISRASLIWNKEMNFLSLVRALFILFQMLANSIWNFRNFDNDSGLQREIKKKKLSKCTDFYSKISKS